MPTKATFQCSLCPKHFTRAFNLRSHLRTHAHARPFACSVCGKSFTRHNDRKSHEALHTGEKTFVCRGNLVAGGTWGCGRRFAQAKNLGRHFRCETGRACILPLAEEEFQAKQQQHSPWALEMLKKQSSQLPAPATRDQNITLLGQNLQPELGETIAIGSPRSRQTPSETNSGTLTNLGTSQSLPRNTDPYHLVSSVISGKPGDELQWTFDSEPFLDRPLESATLWFGDVSVRSAMIDVDYWEESGEECTIWAVVPEPSSHRTIVPLFLTFPFLDPHGKPCELPLGYFKYRSPPTSSKNGALPAADSIKIHSTMHSDLSSLDPSTQVDLLKSALEKAGIELETLLRGEVTVDKRPPTKVKSCLSCRKSKLKCCRLYSDGPGPCDRCIKRDLSCVR